MADTQPPALPERLLTLLEHPDQLRELIEATADGQDRRLRLALQQPLPEVQRRLPLPPELLADCERMGIAVLAVAELAPEAAALALMDAARARRFRAVPVLARRGLVAVAMEQPTDPAVLGALDFASSHRVIPLLATPEAVRNAIARHYDQSEDAAIARELGLDPGGGQEPGDVRDIERLSREKPVVAIVHDIINEAIRRRASDIHLRPGEDGADLLYRIDDELVPVRRFLRALVPAVVSRIKVIAGMNLAEHRRPQDGRASFTLDDGRKVDLRMSVLPAIFGESVVVRLLDTLESLRALDQLGFGERDTVLIGELMQRSHGMFLTTGPTGCGKSTTLYAMLLELRKQRINVLTVEDPVEFYIEGIQQMQVNRAAGFTFASAMRNFLRHDPDVIMVGEIRDRETAAIAVESALTGHLVMSTLHTNTAATTVARLLELGVEAYLLRASLLGVLAQRLVRLTCPHCREPEDVDPHVREVMGVGPEEVFQAGRGCPHCNGLGVHRRMAVYELLQVTPAIRALIVPGAEADRIHEAALAQGMVPITQAALALARQGVISLQEAWRVRTD